MKTCEFCGTEFPNTHWRRRFCTPKCQTSAWYVTNGWTTKEQLLEFRGNLGSTKDCPNCGKSFVVNPMGRGAKQRFCSPACGSAYSHKYNKTSRSRVLKGYGLTIQQYDDMLEAQENKCLICGAHTSVQERNFPVDHNHKTGEVRGLLCSKCNTMLGWFEANEESILKYLRRDK